MTKSATYDRKLMPRKIRDPDQDKIEIFFVQIYCSGQDHDRQISTHPIPLPTLMVPYDNTELANFLLPKQIVRAWANKNGISWKEHAFSSKIYRNMDFSTRIKYRRTRKAREKKN